jgi:hypothetical protein
MSYSMEVIQREIDKLKNRQSKIELLLKVCPGIEFLELQAELGSKLSSGVDRTSPDFIKWLQVAVKKEKSLKLKMNTYQEDEKKLWDEQLQNMSKLNELIVTYATLSFRRSA